VLPLAATIFGISGRITIFQSIGSKFFQLMSHWSYMGTPIAEDRLPIRSSARNAKGQEYDALN
jgi:hypothetical protein